jgi:hypothetical protein
MSGSATQRRAGPWSSHGHERRRSAGRDGVSVGATKRSSSSGSTPFVCLTLQQQDDYVVRDVANVFAIGRVDRWLCRCPRRHGGHSATVTGVLNALRASAAAQVQPSLAPECPSLRGNIPDDRHEAERYDAGTGQDCEHESPSLLMSWQGTDPGDSLGVHLTSKQEKCSRSARGRSACGKRSPRCPDPELNGSAQHERVRFPTHHDAPMSRPRHGCQHATSRSC